MSAKTRYLKLMDRPRKGWKLADRAVFLRRFVAEATALIEEGLARDGVVKIHEFGSFQLKWNEARAGRNPRTGAAITIPAQYRVTFKPVEKLERRVNWPYVHLKPEFIALPPPKIEIKKVDPAPWAQPAVIPLFDLEEEAVVQASLSLLPPTRINEPFAPAYVRPPLSWSPASPPPARMRFDFLEEPEETAIPESVFTKKIAVGGNGEHKNETGWAAEIRTRPNDLVPARPVPYVPPVRRPSFMLEAQQARDRRPRGLKWLAGVVALLLFLLLFFAKPIREQWHRVVAGQNREPVAVALTTQRADHAVAKPAAPAESIHSAATAPAAGFAGGTHEVIKGDNLWGISGHYYLDPYLWPNIYRVNMNKIGDPNLLEPHQLLSLPILFGTFDHLTSEDRRNLAEGYFLVFNHYQQTQKHLAPFALWAAVRFDPAILETHKEAIGAEELAFLQAHNVDGIAAR